MANTSRASEPNSFLAPLKDLSLATSLFSASAAFIATDATSALAASTSPTPLVARAENPRDVKLAEMSRKFQLSSSKSSLDSVLSAISTLTGVRIEPLWQSDRLPSGISPDAEINIPDKSITIRQGLDLISEQLSQAGTPTTWQVLEDGRLQIGSKESLDRYQETKIYEIADLLAATPTFANAPDFNINAALQQGISGNGGGAIIGDPVRSEAERAATRADSGQLTDLIRQVIEPDQWIENGGSGGSIREFRGALIIKAAPYVHRALMP